MSTPLLTVVFDLDGTLIDSRADIARACNHVLRTTGRSELPEDLISTYVGDGARALVARATNLAETDPEVDALVEAFLDFYTEHPTEHTELMPGAAEALRAFANRPISLCTNKPRRTTNAVLMGLGLERHFAVVVAGDDAPQKKPHPAPLELVASRLGVSTASLVMVGDGPQDVECGHAVGAHTVGVRGGLLPLKRLVDSRPDVLLDSLSELPAWLRALEDAKATSGDSPAA